MTALVTQAAIFRTFDETAAAALMTDLQPVHFHRREQIFHEGDVGDTMYVITSGKVKLGQRSPDGRNRVSEIIGPSEMFGELSMFDPGPRTANATALTEVDAVRMTRDAFQKWVVDRPEMAEMLLRSVSRRLRRTDRDLADLVFADVASRVAKQLLRLAQRFGVQENGAMRVTHHLTQGELAQLTGATRETVNKVISDFTRRGWVRPDGQSMLILESEALVRRANR